MNDDAFDVRAVYTPWTKGKYDVAPSLKPLGADYGNGEQDRHWFQFDDRYEEFLEGKRAALADDPAKYVFRSELSPEVEAAAVGAISARLKRDFPARFGGSVGTTLDEIAMQVQEDICVIRLLDGRDWLAYAHVCAPSHWLAAEKIGRSFFDVHTVIPGFESVNRVALSLVEAMITKGPFVRFVWGVESDSRPNHHPIPPVGADPKVWDGRDFSAGKFWMRAERQVIWGLPEVSAAIFTIRVSHLSGEQVLAWPSLLEPLISSLESMSPASREYKGLARDWDRLMSLLTGSKL